MSAPFDDKPQAPGRRASIALAVAVHVLLAAFLIYGVHWQSERPEAVEVELVRSVPVQPAAEPPPPEPKPEPRPEPTPKPEPKPEPKPLPPPKPDIAVKEKEKPKPPPKEEPKPKFDPFQEALKHETEQLAQRKAVDAAAAELAQLKSAQAATARDRAVADYLSKIRAKIRGNIMLPPGLKGNPEAMFDVTQLPSGEILGVKLKSSSGNAALDAAIERAILKSSPLPKPGQSDVFNRNLELKFRPLEE
jgi:colicin import membrane protein